MKIRDHAADAARAIAFLSRIPMPRSLFAGHDGSLGHLVPAFPLAGLVIALPSAIILFLLLNLRGDALMAALIALTVQALVTGALHEDGLADTADGIGGGRDREHALAIMKDSRIGTYGAVALILSFAIRAAAIAAIARAAPPLATVLALPAVAAVSRGALAWHWQRLPPAKSDGVAASSGRPDEGAMQAALVGAGLLATLLLWPGLGLLPLVCCLLSAGIAAVAFTVFIRRRLAGHTGDTLGATQQICEMAAFCALAMAL